MSEQEATAGPPEEKEDPAPAADDAAPKEEESTATFEPVVGRIDSQSNAALIARRHVCLSRIYAK